MCSMTAAESAILLHLKTLRIILLVFLRAVISLFALCTSKHDFFACTCFCHLLTSLIALLKNGHKKESSSRALIFYHLLPAWSSCQEYSIVILEKAYHSHYQDSKLP